MSTDRPRAKMIALTRSPLPGSTGWLDRLWQTFLSWQERASSRHRLSLMSEYDLKDIGITRTDAEGEINKPFWRR